MTQPYDNADRKCECWLCERNPEFGGSCPYCNKYQRHPDDLAPGGLGLCPLLLKKGKGHDEGI